MDEHPWPRDLKEYEDDLKKSAEESYSCVGMKLITKFNRKLKEIYSAPYDETGAHEAADDLMCETLKKLGFDVTVFEEAERWYE